MAMETTSVAQERKILKENDKNFFQNRRNHRTLRMDPGFREKLRQSYQTHFKQFLASNPKIIEDYGLNDVQDVCAFDSEEYHDSLVCFCAITVNTSSELQTEIFVLKNIIDKKQNDAQLNTLFQKFLHKHDFAYVVAHGQNSKESQILQTLKSIQINSAELMPLLRKAKLLPNHVKNLSDFESHIGYQRKACKFFKHVKKKDSSGWNWKMPFQAMNHSLLLHFKSQEQRTCLTCNGIQDVLLYCCEDAFSAFLIYCLYKKHEKKILDYSS